MTARTDVPPKAPRSAQRVPDHALPDGGQRKLDVAVAAQRKEAIKSMAAYAGTSAEDFEKLMAGTDIFTDPKRCTEFMKGEQIKKTQESVKTFLNKHEKLDDMSAKVDFDAQFIPAK